MLRKPDRPVRFNSMRRDLLSPQVQFVCTICAQEINDTELFTRDAESITAANCHVECFEKLNSPEYVLVQKDRLYAQHKRQLSYHSARAQERAAEQMLGQLDDP